MDNVERLFRLIKVMALAWAMCLISVSSAQSDACSYAAGSRYTVNNACVYQNFDKPTSFVPNLAPTTCGGGNFDDAFGWFTATATTTSISYDPDDFHNPIMHIYSGACATLTYLTCVNTGGNGAIETISLTTVIGTNYLIRIQRSGTSNEMGGRLCVWSPPANDNCANAIDLPVFDACFMQTFTNTGSTVSGTTPNPVCSSAPNTDVWFRFVAPSSGAVRIYSERGTLADGSFQLYTGTCGSLSLVPGGCDDDGGVPPNADMPFLDRRCTPLTGGTTYYIRFWGWNGATGTFGLCVYGPDFFPTPQQDCGGGFTVCNSGPINNASDWTGCTTDLYNSNNGCLDLNEQQGTWYYFAAQAVGTIGFTLQPTNNMGNPVNVDYDFAVWGPHTTPVCPPASAPIRCSFADPDWLVPPSYTTGMAAGNTDPSEPPYNNPPMITYVNGFVAPITVAPADVGKIYVLYLDNFTAGGQAFNLTWALGGGPNQLDCTILPISIISLEANRYHDVIAVEWTAQDAAMNERFIVEHSLNGTDFKAIGTLPANGGIGGRTDYRFDDLDPHDGLNFYRLSIIDVDGGSSFSEVVSVFFRRNAQSLVPQPNPSSHEIYVDMAEFAASGIVELRVHDSSGRMVTNRFSDPEGEETFMRLAVESLDAGYYLLGLYDRTGELISTGRFVKE